MAIGKENKRRNEQSVIMVSINPSSQLLAMTDKIIEKMKAPFSFALTILFALVILPWSSGSRPDPEDAPTFARWLVRQGSWGVLDHSLQPFGNVISYADNAGAGIPYFYLATTLDPTGVNALHNSRSSFTLSESVLGYCNATTDPQSPVCAKITLSGNLRMLAKKSKEAAVAEAALFASHPQFAGFPKQNGFRVFKLVIRNIFLVNKYAPPRNLTVDHYFHV